MKKIQSKKGITLISLVITIIVIVVLAAVAINIAIANNGLISKTREAKRKQYEAEVLDNVSLYITQMQMDDAVNNTITTLENLKDRLPLLDNKGSVEIIEYNTEENALYGIYKIKGVTVYFLVDEKLNVHILEQTKFDFIISVSSITVEGFEIKAKEIENSFEKYTYVIKNDIDEIKIENQTTENYIVTGLEPAVTYEVYAEAYDNKGEKYISNKKIVITKSMPDSTKEGVVTISNPTWSNGKATITIETTEKDFYIEYQVNDIEGVWTTSKIKGETVTTNDLNNGDVVFIRLTNGSKSGKYTTASVLDLNPPSDFICQISNVTKDEFTLTGNTTDLETGIKEYTYIVLNNEGTEVKRVEAQKNNSCTITGLSHGTTYNAYIIAYDYAGNSKETPQASETTKIPILVSNIELSIPKKYVQVGASGTITATITPDNADDKTVTWSSSDNSIVSVSDAGVVTGIGSGKAIITCASNDGNTTKTIEISSLNGTLISTRAELEAINNNPNLTYYLVNDIDLGDGNWTPICPDSKPFRGTLDGQGYSIKNLTISGNMNCMAFFSYADGGTIKNIKFENVNIYNTSYDTSAVAGFACGTTIENVAVDGEIKGKNVASIAAWTSSDTTIRNCYARTKLTTLNEYDCAGIVTVKSSGHPKAINCYWSGTMNAKYRCGPIGKSNENDNRAGSSQVSITNCYYNTDQYNLSGDKGGAVGLSTKQFADSMNFTGWDFEKIWKIKDGYPELRVFKER